MATLPPLIRKLGWVSFFADICSEMVYPVLPIFLTGVLKAPVQALGVIEGVANAMVSVMKGWSGWHSDKSGVRLPYVRGGYFLSALGKPILALANVWPTVLAGRMLDRLGKGIRTSPRDALIADSVDKENYGHAYGYHRAMDSAGAFVGVLLAWALIHWELVSLRSIFVIAFIPGLISVAFTFLIKDPNRPAQVPVSAEPEPPKVQEPLRLSRPYWVAVTLSILFAGANSSDMFVLLRVKDLGFSADLVIAGYLLYNFVYAAISTKAGVIADKSGRWNVLLVGWLLYAGVYCGLGFGLNVWVMLALYGITIGLTDGVSKAVVAAASPANGRGRAIGLFTMLTGFASLLGNLAASWLWDVQGAQAAFWLGSGFSAVAAVGILLFRKTHLAS